METQILVHGLELGELTIGDLIRPLSELVWIASGKLDDKPFLESLPVHRYRLGYRLVGRN
jgi:hypothetical protein